MEDHHHDMVQGAIVFMEWLKALPPSQSVTALHSAFEEYLHIFDEADFSKAEHASLITQLMELFHEVDNYFAKEGWKPEDLQEFFDDKVEFAVALQELLQEIKNDPPRNQSVEELQETEDKVRRMRRTLSRYSTPQSNDRVPQQRHSPPQSSARMPQQRGSPSARPYEEEVDPRRRQRSTYNAAPANDPYRRPQGRAPPARNATAGPSQQEEDYPRQRQRSIYNPAPQDRRPQDRALPARNATSGPSRAPPPRDDYNRGWSPGPLQEDPEGYEDHGLEEDYFPPPDRHEFNYGPRRPPNRHRATEPPPQHEQWDEYGEWYNQGPSTDPRARGGPGRGRGNGSAQNDYGQGSNLSESLAILQELRPMLASAGSGAVLTVGSGNVTGNNIQNVGNNVVQHIGGRGPPRMRGRGGGYPRYGDEPWDYHDSRGGRGYRNNEQW